MKRLPTYGPELAQTRRAHGWGQRLFARRVGVSQTTLGSWEREERIPTAKQQERVLTVLREVEKEAAAPRTQREVHLVITLDDEEGMHSAGAAIFEREVWDHDPLKVPPKPVPVAPAKWDPAEVELLEEAVLSLTGWPGLHALDLANQRRWTAGQLRR